MELLGVDGFIRGSVSHAIEEGWFLMAHLLSAYKIVIELGTKLTRSRFTFLEVLQTIIKITFAA